jgi:P pilus assembly chaperone PapD
MRGKPGIRFRLAMALALLAASSSRAAATTVAPHALFIDHRVRSAALYLHNTNDKPVEIEVELVYGYPRGDGEGGIRVFLEPEPADREPSCAEWIRALPRRVILQPGDRQTVRFLARPPAGLPDGEYWSRVVVTSQPAERDPEATELQGVKGVRVGLTLATRTIVSLNYRKGPVTTGVEVKNLSAVLGERTIILGMDLKRQGDAAWLGQVDAVLLDVEGQEVGRWVQALAVYEDHRRVLQFPFDRPQQLGHYKLSLRYNNERADLPPEGILPSTAVVRTIPLIAMVPPGD